MTDESRTAGFGALIWLAVATFSMGIDGYVLAGLLPQIADDLDVDPAAAGQLMAVFALTSAVAGPVLGALTGRWERKGTIVGALAVFVVGNVVVAVAPTYAWAMTGRIVSALGAALLNAVVSAYVIAKTPEERRGRALSLVLGGWLAATALGVPIGLVIGQEDWRIPLILVAVVGAAALVGIVLKVPRLHLPPLSLRRTLQPLTQGRILVALLVPAGIMTASYLCFTYATLILGPRVGTGLAMVVVMFGYGVLSLLGNIVSGRLTDRFRPTRVLTGIIGALVVVALLGTAGLALPGAAGAVAAVLWFLASAVGNGGSGVPLQARLGGMAPDSVALVVALNGSAMSLGSAIGAALGGVAVAGGIPADALLPLSAAILLVTFVPHAIVARREGRVLVTAA
ncbi:putative MFS family arabinose efflux permease [Microbacterium resistens]|uniref:MFS family arabinose efflux permease n=1 Tax=Microbacterium resistens TaxID=156977 RepID=A0ABU1SAX9_9MICO|nr:MFS transporter [Microbacterium resistens]MDR6866754.1 putative MFS family arabinose efflux permease [Microbacterium resistens]